MRSAKERRERHRYWSICENRRTQDGQRFQRQALYLGEINDSQKANWTEQIPVLDSTSEEYATMALFPEDRMAPSQVLRRSRFGWEPLRSAVPVTGERVGWPCGLGSFSSWMSFGRCI